MPIPNLNDLLAQNALPGLRQPDTRIAQAWLRAHGQEYDSVDFNVRLGQGIVLPDSADPSLKLFAQATTTKRADMVAHQNGDVTIVEIKVRVNGAALGQLVLYRRLYRDAFPSVGYVRLVVAGQYREPDIDATYADYGIEIETFPAALP